MKCENCECCEKGFVRSKPDTYFCIGCKEPYEVYPEQECNNSNRLNSHEERPDFFDELFDDSTFNERMDLLKDYFADSVKDDVKKVISDLQKKNTELTNEIEKLRAENEHIKEENKKLSKTNEFGSCLTSFINKDNVYKFIECIFDKTFNEDTDRCKSYWATYVNYYDNRKDIIKILKYVGECPDGLEDVVLPHEWDEDMLEQFFNHMTNNYVCNGNIYEDNLKYWDYKRALSPFSPGITEIPWQFVLRNPLLNNEKYAHKVVDAINTNGYGEYFSRILEYQTLDETVLEIIINGIDIHKKYISSDIINFVCENINLIIDADKLDYLYDTISKKWKADEIILNMPSKYQIKFFKEVKPTLEFLKKMTIPKEEKKNLLEELL